MNGTLKISVVVFSRTCQDRVGAKKVNLFTDFCTEEKARKLAKEWVNMNKETFNMDSLSIVFIPDAVDISIDELV